MRNDDDDDDNDDDDDDHIYLSTQWESMTRGPHLTPSLPRPSCLTVGGSGGSSSSYLFSPLL